MKNESNEGIVNAMANAKAVPSENDLSARIVKLMALVLGLVVAGFVIKMLLLEILNHLMRNVH